MDEQTTIEDAYQRIQRVLQGGGAVYAQRSPGFTRFSVWTVMGDDVIKIDHDSLGGALVQLVREVESRGSHE